MSTLSLRLQSLAHNRYFAFAAIIFFAFLTALVFALIGLQRTQGGPSSLSGVGSGAGTYYPAGGGAAGTAASPGSASQPSLIDRVVSVFTGGSQTPGTATGPGQGAPGQSAIPSQGTGSTGNQGSTAQSTDVQRQKSLDYSVKLSSGAPSLPAISIQKSVLMTELPPKPNSLTIYNVQTTFSEDFINQLAEKLKFRAIDATERGERLYRLYDLEGESALSFNPATGRFTYLSESGFIPDVSGSTPFQIGKNVVAQLGIDTAAIKPLATYERNDDNADHVYVELHYDWGLFGAPIINPVGALNLTRINDIADVQLGALPENAPKNINITNTSDKTDGYARRDDFNTVTVVYSPTDKKVYGVSSNIPFVTHAEPAPAESIKTATQAYNEFLTGSSTIALTGPAGEGTVDLPDVYSDNTARAQSIDVVDAAYVYAAFPYRKTELWCPVYMFRSFGKIQTGFEVQFIHTVPAVNDPRCAQAVLGSHTNKPVYLAQKDTAAKDAAALATPTGLPVTPIVGGSDKNASSLQYGTKVFAVSLLVDTPANECPPNLNHSYKIAETPATVEYMMWRDVNPENYTRRTIKGREWYYVIKKKAGSDSTATNFSPTKSTDAIFKLRVKLVYRCTIGDAEDCPLDQSAQGLETISCQYLTTGSPWIHLYPTLPTQTTVSIRPTGGIAYAHPSLSSDTGWTVLAHPDGTLAVPAHDGSSYSFDALHWEYYAHDIQTAYHSYAQKPADGYVIQTSELEPFVSNLLRRIGLTHAEQQNVLADLRRSSSTINAPFTRISFAPQSFLNEVLPITISPQPKSLNRLFLVLSPRDRFERINLPQLPTLRRDGFTAVETGVLLHR